MTRRYVIFGLMVVLTLLTPTIAHAQGRGDATPAPAPPTALRVTGDVVTPLSLSAADLKAMPRTKVSVKDENGVTITYEGALVSEILKKAGAPLGGDLRGTALTTYVVASATDGYAVVFSLAELDPAMTNSEIIVADMVNGKPLAASQGPWRIATPKDTRPSRAVRQLERIEVVRLKK